MNISKNDKRNFRELTKQYASVALLDIHQEKIKEWKRLNALIPSKPMIMIDYA